jgi:hypothetical protein
VDELIQPNFPERVEVLDVPLHGGRMSLATNTTTISTIRTNPPLRVIQVDCVWAYHDGRLFTNTVVTYRAPDQ